MPGYGGSNGPDGSRKSGDQGQGTRDANGGNTGGGRSVGRDPTHTDPNHDRKIREAYAQYAGSMKQAGMANLAGPPGYNGAVHEYNNRPWGWDILDFLAGPFVNVKRPDPTIPGSYSGGTWHTSTSLPGVAGALGGMALGVPGLGMIGSGLGDLAGIPDVYHGSYDDGSALHSPSNSSPGSPFGGQDKAGHGGGLLDLSNQWSSANNQPPAPQGILGLASPTPGASQWVKNAANQQWGFQNFSVPGPTPYNVQTARWL